MRKTFGSLLRGLAISLFAIVVIAWARQYYLVTRNIVYESRPCVDIDRWICWHFPLPLVGEDRVSRVVFVEKRQKRTKSVPQAGYFSLALAVHSQISSVNYGFVREELDSLFKKQNFGENQVLLETYRVWKRGKRPLQRMRSERLVSNLPRGGIGQGFLDICIAGYSKEGDHHASELLFTYGMTINFFTGANLRGSALNWSYSRNSLPLILADVHEVLWVVTLAQLAKITANAALLDSVRVPECLIHNSTARRYLQGELVFSRFIALCRSRISQPVTPEFSRMVLKLAYRFVEVVKDSQAVRDPLTEVLEWLRYIADRSPNRAEMFQEIARFENKCIVLLKQDDRRISAQE